MKRTGAVILSMMMVMVLTVTNLAGAYQTVERVYAAEEESISREDNAESTSSESQDDETSGGSGDNTMPEPQDSSSEEGGNTSASSGDDASASAPATFFTVTFDANGHGTAPGAVSVVAGECVEKPADLSADGFLFTGWYRDADATIAWDFDTDTVNGDITLYAGWAELTTGASASPEGSSPSSQGATTPSQDDTTSTLVGNNTSSEGTGNNSAEGGNTTESFGTNAATTFTVTFDANGHGTAPNAVTVTEGETLQKLADPTEDGYTFTGWYKDKEATDEWNFDTDTASGNITLYAGWTENIQRALQNTSVLRNGNTDVYSVTVTSNGYGSVEASPTSGTEGTEVTLTAKPQSGYSFDKWEVISGGVTPASTTSATTTFEISTEDVEVRAIFKYDETNYYIKIDPSLQNLKFGKPVTLRLSEGGLSNGEITWTSSDPSTLSINGTEATFHKTGTVRITASQAADGEFAAVTDSLEVTIGKGDASTIDWPTPGPVYYQSVFRDVALNGGSTEFGSFAWGNPTGIEHGNPGQSTGFWVDFSPKSELAEYFVANIRKWVTYTVQARDTLDSCISVNPNTIDFGTVEQKNLDTVSEIQVMVFNRTDLSAAPVYVNITPGDNEYFGVRNASGGSTASPKSQIMFHIEPKTTLTPGAYEVPITFTAATSTESVEKILTAKIVVTDNLPEASVTISPNITQFSLMEGYDPDKYAQTITLTNTGTEPLEITDYTFKGGRYSFDLERISTSSTIPVGGTVEYRIKPIAGHTYPGYALRSPHSLRFILKDPNGQQSAKETTVVMRIDEYVDYFGSLTVTPDTLDFGTETAGYQMLPEQTISFSNNQLVMIKDDRYPKSSNYILRFWLDDMQMINSTIIVSSYIPARMTVAPRQGLPAGNYDETLEIEFYNTAGDMETRQIHLKFTVEKSWATVTATNDGNGTASASVSPAKEGTIVYLSATPNNGYQFSHWEVTSGGVTLDDEYSQMTAFKIGKDDVSVKAHFKEIPTGEYRISVVTDGHGSASSDPKSGTTGDDVNLSAKAAEGYYFVRWEVVSGGVQIADATNPKPQRPAFKIGDSDVEIKAVFAKNPYQVTVTVEGLGTAEAAPDSGRAGDTVSLTATPREYYRFKEWRITSGSGTIADKTSATTTFTFANESAEVKAVFEAIPYDVDITYVGEGTVKKEPGTYNNEFALTAIPADGYRFYMWEVIDRSTGVITAVGNTNKAFIGVRCDAERIKLRVTFNVIPYSITYTLNGGTNASGNPDTYTVEDTIVLAEPGRDGFTFDGWYDAGGNKVTTIPEGTTGDLTFEARWSPRPYTITYNLDGGSNHPNNPTTYTVETETITLKEPTKGVMIFDGWYDAGGNKVTQIVKNSTGDITLTARWKKAPAPAITFPTASDITYGQTLADSVLTGGSTEYGTFMWKMPSFVPMAGNIGWDLEFIPSADTEKYYEPIADADKTAKVKVRVNAATPALTVSAEKKDATTASLTATVQKAGEGMAPRGTVKFEVSEDHGANWTVIASGVALTEKNGNGEASTPWTFSESVTEYKIRASYDSGTDANYNDATATISFDPSKEDQTGFAVVASPADVSYGDALRFSVSNARGTGALTYTVSDDSVLTVDTNGNATILKAGTVIVTATKAGDATYNAATTSVSVTVKKAKLTFTADDKTVNLGGAMPTLTFTTTGLVSGDTVSTDPDLTTTATGTNTAGTFDIQITGGAVTTKNGAVWTDCYDVSRVDGKLIVKNMYTISVTANPSVGGTVTGGGTFAEGDKVSLTAIANSGYRFVRWSEGGTEASANASFTFAASATRNLVAEFVEDAAVTSVTVTPSQVDVMKGKTQQFTAQVVVSGAGSITKTVTWSVSGANRSGTTINARTGELTVDKNETATVLTVKATSDADPSISGTATVNVKANVSGTVTVTFDTKGGTAVASQTVTKGSTISAPTSTRTGYILAGWLDPNGKLFDFSNPINADIILTAQWKSDAVVTRITISPANAEVVIDRTQQKEGSQQFTAKVEGTGAYSSAVTWSVNGNTSAKTTISAEGLLTVGADEASATLTVTAVSKENASVKDTATVTVKERQPDTYTVKFDANGGSAVASQQVKKNEKASKPADPTRSGYTFRGWNLNGKPYDFNTSVTSDITLTAVWELNDSTELTVEVRGFSDADIPQSLINAGYDTTAKIQNALLKAVVERNDDSFGKNYALYEVVLMVSFDGGQTWVVATPENFPAGGITVLLSYPSGTGQDTHEFAISHMFTVNMRGHKPGDIENPKVTKTPRGIQVTLDGLSPVLVSWTEKKSNNQPTPANPTNPSNPGGDNNGTNPTPGTSDTSAQPVPTVMNGDTATAVQTGTTTSRSTTGQDGQNARMAQTGDDMYERLGLHTLILLAALLLLIANLRKLMEEKALLAVSRIHTSISTTGESKKKKRTTGGRTTKSGLEFIELDASYKGAHRAKRCDRNHARRNGRH